MTKKPKFPNVHVELSRSDGNSFFIIGNVIKAMRRAGIDDDSIKEFSEEAKMGDYDHVIQTCMKYVEVD